jgi:arsenate reductase
MTMAPRQVLFLCTGNSARSILAEFLLAHHGRGRFVAHSAGSHPKGTVHPLAVETLERHGISAAGARSKSWDEMGVSGAPAMDLIITVCDAAAQETCPVWPGHPTTVHWGIPDPAAAAGSIADRRRAFEQAYQALHVRIRGLTALRDDQLEGPSAVAALRAIHDGHAAEPPGGA